MSAPTRHLQTGEEAARKPRAPVRARATDVDGPAVVGVRLGPQDRRTPLVLVDVRLGPAVVTFGFARLRRGRWEVRCPADANGAAAVRLPSRMQARVVEMVREAAESTHR
ncbi:hypothetical protein [Sabulicella rubraurantiaca]|uniref:hypothetical protein n=1 Tax=Sabulicella rubraurantiaca TaxID=2811429 RepID=UPI001A9799B2|nr:hypothetical protein [Sabulicella rubraurantiaca]